jgi:vancomycin permeability regulator SanA
VILNIVIVIINLFFLYFTKYSNQNLKLSEFNLYRLGNLLNLLFALILILGLLIIHFKKITLDKKSFYSFFILNQFLLMLAYLATKIPIPFNDYYLFGQKGNRLLIGFIFSQYQFTYFILCFFVWHTIFKTKSFILIRSVVNSTLLLFFILIISFVFIIAKENTFKEKSIKTLPNNVAVVLGAAVWTKNKLSPTLEARVKKSIDLLNSRKISEIYLTGGNAPGELAESQVAFNYIKSKVNDTSNIYKETKTASTNEQIEFVEKILFSKSNIKNIIVISDSYHLVRVMEISKFHNIKIQVAPSELNLSFENAIYFKVREALALTVFWFFAF